MSVMSYSDDEKSTHRLVNMLEKWGLSRHVNRYSTVSWLNLQYLGEDGDVGEVGEYFGDDGDIWAGASSRS